MRGIAAVVGVPTVLGVAGLCAEVTANTCFGTKAQVREKVGEFFRGLTHRTDGVKRRCRTVLQTQADAFTSAVQAILQPTTHVDPTLALV
jgi:hypothetical protein